jgi:hypothetical protein
MCGFLTKTVSVAAVRSDLLKMILRRRPVLALTGLVLLALGCSGASTGASMRGPAPSPSRRVDQAPPVAGVINHSCPITGRAVAPDAPTVAHKGHTIGLCGDACVAGWERLREPIKDNFVARNANR